LRNNQNNYAVQFGRQTDGNENVTEDQSAEAYWRRKTSRYIWFIATLLPNRIC